MRLAIRVSAVVIATAQVACLDPLVDDDIDPSIVFDAPTSTLDNARHVEANPEFASKVAQFPTSIQYLKGFSEGQPVWYWNVPGPVASFVVDLYVVVKDGEPIGAPIIDAIPGDGGYSPWWRKVIVKTTATYADEKIHSRDAIDLGVRLGILESPAPTNEIINCPVVKAGLEFDTGDPNKKGTTSGAWYRNHRVDWVRFSGLTVLPTDANVMLVYPVYVFQRSSEPFPIYELVSGVDEDRDTVLDNSNNVFAATNLDDRNEGRRYSPLWNGVLIKTTADYPSIDTAADPSDGRPVGLTGEDQFIDVAAMESIRADVQFTSTSTDRPVVSKADLGLLINCPIQRARGTF